MNSSDILSGINYFQKIYINFTYFQFTDYKKARACESSGFFILEFRY